MIIREKASENKDPGQPRFLKSIEILAPNETFTEYYPYISMLTHGDVLVLTASTPGGKHAGRLGGQPVNLGFRKFSCQ